MKILFWFIVIFTLLPAVYITITDNLVRATFSLFITLFGMAGIYAYLGADFIAGVQVLLYVGGIGILLLFAVLMTKKPTTGAIKIGWKRNMLALIISLCVFALVFFATLPLGIMPPAENVKPTTYDIGSLLMTRYLFPFEVVSVVLAGVLVGAALIIRREVKR